MLRERAEHDGERDGFIFLRYRGIDTPAEERLTYGALLERAKAIAATLQAGSRRGDRILILCPPGHDYIVAFFACQLAGMVAVPAYPPRNAKHMGRLRAILADAGASAILVTTELSSRLIDWAGGSERLPRLVAIAVISSDAAAAWVDPNPRTDDLAFLQYTSGTTGSPKGVMIRHAAAFENIRYIATLTGLDPAAVGASWLPPYHDMGLVGAVLTPVSVGFPVVLMAPAAFLQRPGCWLEAMTAYRATITTAPNFAYQLCVDEIAEESLNGYDLTALRHALSGAERVRAATLSAFSEKFARCGFAYEHFVPAYGMAETVLLSTSHIGNDGPKVLSLDDCEPAGDRLASAGRSVERNRPPVLEPRRAVVSCGPVIPDHDIRIVDPTTCRPVREGATGEIWISGPSVAAGYWNKPEESAATFAARLAEEPQGGIYLRTGDLGSLIEGELYVLGRIKELLIIRGRNHYAQDIEATATAAHTSLKPDRAAAFSVEVGPEGVACPGAENAAELREEALVVVHELDRSALRRLDGNAVCAAIRQAILKEHEIDPQAIVLIKPASLPRTTSGKIQCRRTREQFLAGELAEVFRWAHSAPSLPSDASDPLWCPALIPPDRTDRPALERWLQAVIAQAAGLAPEKIDLDQALTELGIDSLAAAQVAAHIERSLGVALDASQLYDYPSIRSLGTYLDTWEARLPLWVDGTAASYTSQRRVATAANYPCDPIAIVGMACRFPGANDIREFWKLLRTGGSAVGSVPSTRWDAVKLGAEISCHGAFLEGIEHFDARFFRIAPVEALAMDPQQRLLLEVSWQALEDAGIVPERLRGTRCGVYIGIGSNDYARLLALQGPTDFDLYRGTGNANSVAAGRLAYVLGLQGPALAIDTACSSSLVAIDNACDALRQGKADLVLAGGVNALLTPDLTIAFSRAGMLSPDGRCKTFDASADGYVRGEGCGLVVLKRVADAERDGDRIFALIRGSAINQDGASNGLTAPHGPAQQALIEEALGRANLSPKDVDYLEAHGTGTELGDPIEVRAAAAAYGAEREPSEPLLLGSVKTNIGHLEAAAGVAGLIKVVLALRHHLVPKHLNFQTPSPRIDWKRLPVQVTAEATPLSSSSERPLRAGVSSFGFSGTNAHVILEAYEKPQPEIRPWAQGRTEEGALGPEQAPEPLPERSAHLLPLSAKSEPALKELAQRYQHWLAQEANRKVALTDLCFTAGVGRSHFDHRAALLGKDKDQLSEALAQLGASKRTPSVYQGRSTQKPKIALLFTGQGSQYRGMAKELYATHLVFRTTLDRCAEALDDKLDKPLRELLFEDPAGVLDNTGYTQPALFALEAALYETYHALGIEADIVLGHSVGEYAAAYAAGILTLEEGIALIAERGRLFASLPAGGAMAAVFADAQSVEQAIAQINAQKTEEQATPTANDTVPAGTDTAQMGLSIAADNGAHQVISGPVKLLEQALALFDLRGVRSERLKTSHAFHSALLNPILEELEAAAAGIEHRNPTRTLISNRTGEALAADHVLDGAYWRAHAGERVQWARSVQTLAETEVELLLELGPKPVLGPMTLSAWPNGKVPQVIATLRPALGADHAFLESVAGLYAAGCPINFAALDAGHIRHKLSLPTYPFHRERYWIDTEPVTQRKPFGFQQDLEVSHAAHTIFNSQTATQLAPLESLDNWLYDIEWRSQTSPDHPIVATATPRQWLLLADETGIAQGLRRQLEALGDRCTIVLAGTRYQQNPSDPQIFTIDAARPGDYQQLIETLAMQSPSLYGVVHCWSVTAQIDDATDTQDLTEFLQRSCRSTLALVQALTSNPKLQVPPRLWLVTVGAHLVSAQQPIISGFAQTSIWGLAKVIRLEHPELNCVCIDLSLHATVTENTSALAKEVSAVCQEDQVVWRESGRYVARLVSSVYRSSKPEQQPAHGQLFSTMERRNTQPLGIRKTATYLVTGGLGGLGLLVAEWLATHGAQHLVLVSRRSPDAAVQEQLSALERIGTQVLVKQADVSDAAAISAVLGEIKQLRVPLAGILHLAGTWSDGILRNLKWSDFQEVMAPKVQGTWNLHRLTQDQSLDFFVLFSSAASLFGSPAQGNYAAANAFLDGFAHYRRALGMPGLSIHWGFVSQVGAAAERGADTRARKQGLGAIEPAQVLQALDQLVLCSTESSGHSRSAEVGVMPVQWSVWQDMISQWPFLSDWQDRNTNKITESRSTSHTSTSITTTQPQIFELLLTLSSVAQRTSCLTTYLQRLIASILHTQPELIQPTDSVLDLGMDSLMVMEAIKQLKNDLQLNLYPREFYERPKIIALAKYLVAEFERSHLHAETARASETLAVPELESQKPSLLPNGSFPAPAARATDSASPGETSADKLPRMAFILSSPRSGSTLLRVMLAGHSALFSPPELHLLSFLTMAEREQEIALAHLGEGLQRAFMELRGIDAETSQAVIRQLVDKNASITHVYALLQELAGNRMLVDKTPTYGLQSQVLARAELLFDQPKYIHLVRHPYAVMESFVRMRMNKLMALDEDDPYTIAESVWANSNQNIAAFCEQIGRDRHHLIRYEDLVRQPEAVMRELCEFLAISFEPAMLSPYVGARMLDGVHGSKSMPLSDPNFLRHTAIDPKLGDAWKTIELPPNLNPVTGTVARQFKYELPREEAQTILMPVTMQERLITVGDLSLCVCEWGLGPGPLVCCLHGMLDQGAAWSKVAVALARQGYRVVAPDLRGHGRSAHVAKGSSYHLLDFLADVDAVFEQVSDEPFTLIGHSFGSVIAALFASVRPQKVNNLILVETILPAEIRGDEAADQLANHLDLVAAPPQHSVFPDVTTAAQRLAQATPTLDPAFAQELAERSTVRCEGGVQWRWDPLLLPRAAINVNGLGQSQYLDLLKQIPVPVTLIYGEQSYANREEDLRKQQSAMPKAKRFTVSGGHNVHLEAAAALAQILHHDHEFPDFAKAS